MSSEPEQKPPDQTLIVFHLRHGSGPVSDQQVMVTSARSPEEMTKEIYMGWVAARPMTFSTPERSIIVAPAHVAWVDVKRIGERELRRLREAQQGGLFDSR